MYLRTSGYVRLSGPFSGGIPQFSGTHELNKKSVLDRTALNWCRQEVLRARMSNTVLFGQVKDPELVVFNFWGQLQCRNGLKA